MSSFVSVYNSTDGTRYLWREENMAHTIKYRSVDSRKWSDKAEQYALSIVLTQEMNRAGSLTITVSNEAESMIRTRDTIQVSSPYLRDGQLNAAEDKITKWFGHLSTVKYQSDRIVATYDGEMSYLADAVLAPYETTSLNIGNYFTYLMESYNGEQFSTSYYHRFACEKASGLDQGQSTVRSNTSATTYYKEIDDKILSKYNNQISIQDATTPTAAITRAIYMKPTPASSLGVITQGDIIGSIHNIRYNGRYAWFRAYGSKTSSGEGDTGRITQKVYLNSSELPTSQYVSNRATIVKYDDITTTTYLETKTKENAQRLITDTDGIDIQIKPNRAKSLFVGGLYTIFDSRVGISGEYRLMKRSIDIINPTNSKYTFGAANIGISARVG